MSLGSQETKSVAGLGQPTITYSYYAINPESPKAEQM